MHQSTLSGDEIEQEQILVAKAKSDPAAFQPLYDRYYKLMFRYIYHKVRDRELTADLTSRVFLNALVNLKKYADKGLPFSAWLYRIATNEVGQYFRQAGRVQYVVIDEHFLAELREEEDYPEDQAYWQGRLDQAMQTLHPEEIQLLDLRFQEGKPFAEIGLILDITENNAKVKTYRVLDKLRQVMQKPAHQDPMPRKDKNPRKLAALYFL